MIGRFVRNRALLSNVQRNMVMANVPRANFGKYYESNCGEMESKL